MRLSRKRKKAVWSDGKQQEVYEANMTFFIILQIDGLLCTSVLGKDFLQADVTFYSFAFYANLTCVCVWWGGLCALNLHCCQQPSQLISHSNQSSLCQEALLPPAAAISHWNSMSHVSLLEPHDSTLNCYDCLFWSCDTHIHTRMKWTQCVCVLAWTGHMHSYLPACWFLIAA